MTTTAITGSASGIGRALAERLGGEGHRIIGVDIRDADVVADLSTADGRASAVAAVLDACGGTLDRFVGGAGLGPQVSPESIIASVNYFGVVDLLDGLLPALEKGTAPAAVAICSNSAQMAPLDDHPVVCALLDGDEAKARALLDESKDGFVAYAGSKMALGRAVRRRSRDWGSKGVRLNAIAPGPVETPLLQGGRDDPRYGEAIRTLDVPLGRLATPEEIAAFIAMMLAPDTGYMHGSVVYVDGGQDAEIRSEKF